MSFDPALLDLFPDTLIVEPFVSGTVTQDASYGAAVTYAAQIVGEFSKAINREGREVQSMARVLIPGRVHIDPRSRVTLPSGWVPQQPPIISVKPVGGVSSMGLDSIEVVL